MDNTVKEKERVIQIVPHNNNLYLLTNYGRVFNKNCGNIEEIRIDLENL